MYAAPSGESNFGAWDINLQQQRETEQPLPPEEATKKFQENKAIADQQKAEADQKALEQIIQGAKNSSDSVDTPGPDSKKDKSQKEKSKEGTDLVAPAAVVKTWYTWANRNQSNGGSGIGWSGSSWAASDDIRNGSRAEIYGDYWAKAWGWDYYTPTTTGNYNVTTAFKVTGRIITGSSLAVRVKVTDTTNNTTVTRTIFNPSPGYFDDQYNSITESFYLYSGHKYAFTFETETNASALVSATFADFFEKEFDGTQRKIYFWSMSISK